MTQLLKAPEAARALGVGRTKFWELVSLYKVPQIRLDERCVRFDPADLRHLIESRRIAGPADARRLADGRRSA